MTTKTNPTDGHSALKADVDDITRSLNSLGLEFAGLGLQLAGLSHPLDRVSSDTDSLDGSCCSSPVEESFFFSTAKFDAMDLEFVKLRCSMSDAGVRAAV